MQVITDGKTKILYDLGNGLYQLYFKDDMTGVDGVFDPGANTVGLTLEGAGLAGLRLSVYFFELLAAKGVTATHYVSADVDNRTMVIKPVEIFGQGLEIICRYTAMGSFIRRYGTYIKEGAPLDALVEMTLKDDDRNDPLINEEALVAIGVLKPGEYGALSALTKEICAVIRDDLASKGLTLCDIKLEFGRTADGKVCLIDEIAAGNMRVTENGVAVGPLELPEKVMGK